MSYRPDRNEQIIKEIDKIGISPLRIEGEIYTGTNDKRWNGWIGCGLTHLKILKLAQKYETNVMIFEDDCQWINNFKNILNKAFDDLSTLNWDMIYLGGNICKPIQQITPHLGKLSHAQSTHAYGVNKNFINKLIDIIEPNITKKIIDVMYGEDVIPNNNCYITIPMIAMQKSDYSDIEGGYVSYEWMEQRFYDNLVIKDFRN
jgi:GR25 family glycosyltransferase involved in LPS biosynthesis